MANSVQYVTNDFPLMNLVFIYGHKILKTQRYANFSCNYTCINIVVKKQKLYLIWSSIVIWYLSSIIFSWFKILVYILCTKPEYKHDTKGVMGKASNTVLLQNHHLLSTFKGLGSRHILL